MCTELPDDVERFLGSLVAFAEAHDDVRAVALVGSHARGVARPDSDVDVVMLTTEPKVDRAKDSGTTGRHVFETRGPMRDEAASV